MRKVIRVLALLLLTSSSTLGDPPPQLDYGLDNLPIPPVPLVNQTNARTVQLIGDALARSKGIDRVRYTRELGEAERAESLPFLKPLLKDPDPMVREQAIASLGLINHKESAADIKPLLNDPVPAVRKQAVRTGAGLGDPAFVAQGLNDDDAEVVRTSLNLAVAEHGGAIVEKLPKLPPTSQVHAMAALGRIKHAAAADALEKFLDQPLPLKVAALQSLSDIGATAKADQVLAMLKDPHPSARREATLALAGVTAVPVRQERAIAMLRDTDATVRQAAATILKGDPTPTAIDPLVQQLSTDYKPLHLESRNALMAIGAEAIPASVKLLDHEVAERRIDGSWLLGKLKSDAGFERHLALLQDKDWRVVAQVAESLGHVGRPESREPLTQLASKSLNIWNTRGQDFQNMTIYAAGEMAIVSAARLKHEPIIAVVKPILFSKEKPSEMRCAGAWAMGMLMGENEKQIFRRYLDIQDDDMESSSVKAEGIKAIGNARVTSLLGHFKATRGELVHADWLSHWALDRLEGKVTPFNPTQQKFPDLSVVDRP